MKKSCYHCPPMASKSIGGGGQAGCSPPQWFNYKNAECMSFSPIVRTVVAHLIIITGLPFLAFISKA